MEVGCGIGVALVALTRLCQPTRLVGVDIDQELLSEAAEEVDSKHIHAELYQADVRNLPFPDASFDVVIDFGTCYHITYPERALHEIARVLCENGYFIHETPLNQFLSHPVRSFGRRLPWYAVSALTRDRHALLWGRRRKSSSRGVGCGKGVDRERRIVTL